MFGGFHPRTTRRALRLGVAALGTGVVLASYAGVAVADPGTTQGTGTQPATVTGVPTAHSVGTIFDDHDQSVDVSLFDLDLNTGQTVVTFCIDLNHPLAEGKTYVEGNWDKANPGSDMPHILWVLDHSGPLLKADDVLSAAGAPAISDDQRASDIVYMATQAAVWHFSDGFDLGTKTPTFGGQNPVPATNDEATAIQKVYAYLTGSTNTGMSEPAPALSITPDSLSGQVGKAIGPFTVKTTAQTITLTASNGAKLVDAKGNPVDKAGNDDQFSVLLDKAGKATVDAKGSGTVPVGRIFVFQDSPNTKQKLVVATPATLPVSASVTVTASEVAATPSPTATPSPRPAPVLASTGASPWPKIGLAALLLVVGTGMVLLTRKRRATR